MKEWAAETVRMPTAGQEKLGDDFSCAAPLKPGASCPFRQAVMTRTELW